MGKSLKVVMILGLIGCISFFTSSAMALNISVNNNSQDIAVDMEDEMPIDAEMDSEDYGFDMEDEFMAYDEEDVTVDMDEEGNVAIGAEGDGAVDVSVDDEGNIDIDAELMNN